MLDHTYVILDEFGFVVQVMVTANPPENTEKAPAVDNFFEITEEAYYKVGNNWEKLGKSPGIFWKINREEKRWEPDLLSARKTKLKEISGKLEELSYAACNYFDADKVSRERISGMIARLQRGDGLPAGWMGWRDANNDMHWAADDAATVLTNLTALSRAIEDREQALLVASWTHKANIAALTDIDAIIGYDVTANWPV